MKRASYAYHMKLEATFSVNLREQNNNFRTRTCVCQMQKIYSKLQIHDIFPLNFMSFLISSF